MALWKEDTDVNFGGLKLDVSTWFDRHRYGVSMLKVVYRDHVKDTFALHKCSKTMDIIELLIGAGHLTPTNLTLLYDTINLTQQFGLEQTVKDRHPSFLIPKDIRNIVSTEFTLHRQRIVNLGMALSPDEIQQITGLYSVAEEHAADSWNLIMYLEQRMIISEGKMEAFIENLKKYKLRKAVKALTEDAPPPPPPPPPSDRFSQLPPSRRYLPPPLLPHSRDIRASARPQSVQPPCPPSQFSRGLRPLFPNSSQPPPNSRQGRPRGPLPPPPVRGGGVLPLPLSRSAAAATPPPRVPSSGGPSMGGGGGGRRSDRLSQIQQRRDLKPVEQNKDTPRETLLDQIRTANLDPTVKGWFYSLGITEALLKDKNTSKFICDFIEEHGGIDAVKKEAERTKSDGPPPPPPLSRSAAAATPPPPPPAPSSGGPSMGGGGGGGRSDRLNQIQQRRNL